MSTWPTTNATTTMVNLSVPSNQPSSSNVQTEPKPPVPNQSSKMWEKCYPTPVLLSSPVHSDWSSEEDWDETKQKERERLNKIIKEQQRKIAEARRRKREGEYAHYANCIYITQLMLNQIYPY